MSYETKYDNGAQMWFIRETDLARGRERDTKGGWYNCTDAEEALGDPESLEFSNWEPIRKHGIWP